MTEYITAVIIWLCISSGVAITCKDQLMRHKWISADDIRMAIGDGKGKAILKFIAINMVPIFRAFVCVAIIIMAIFDKDDLKW